MSTLSQFDHPSWKTAAGTLVSYLVVLVTMTVLFFGVPYLVFTAF